MQVNSFNISRVFSHGGNIHYILPHFQREYVWDKENWKTLLADVYHICEPEAIKQEFEHFLGSLVVISDGMRDGTTPVFKLVDGQQRLMTVSLMLCAISRIMEREDEKMAQKIKALLVNQFGDDRTQFKIWPTKKYDDQAVYQAIMRGEEPPQKTKSRIVAAYKYIYKELDLKLANKELDSEQLFSAITTRLNVVFINLERTERPYEIFESLNVKGKPLTQPDMVRNYIAMRLPEAEQEEIFDTYWSEIERLLDERKSMRRSGMGELTGFLRHYLTMSTGTLPRQGSVYAQFRDRAEKIFPDQPDFIAEMARLKRFAAYYDHLLRPNTETNEAISRQLERLKILEVPAYPFLLRMYEAEYQGEINQQEFLAGLEMLENYIVRRYLTHEATNNTSLMFSTLWRELETAQWDQSLRKTLVSKNYPPDDRVKYAVQHREIYDKGSRTRQKIHLILETINRHLSKDTGGYTELDDAPTIEHIMPQTLRDDWKKDLGYDWERTYRDYLHTLGNLTLVTQEWNAALSNAPYVDKKKLLENHALRLNSDYFSASSDAWNQGAILARAEFLAQNILDCWPVLGDIPLTRTSTKPQAVIIFEETFKVNSWRDVAHRTAEQVASVTDDFSKVAAEMPRFFSRKKFKRASRQVANEWWVDLDLSADRVKNFCHRLLAVAEIPEEEWRVEEA